MSEVKRYYVGINTKCLGGIGLVEMTDLYREATGFDGLVMGKDYDAIKAENESLLREREGKVLCDLELFKTLRDSANTEADEHRQCMATYRPQRQEYLDLVVICCDELIESAEKGEKP